MAFYVRCRCNGNTQCDAGNGIEGGGRMNDSKTRLLALERLESRKLLAAETIAPIPWPNQSDIELEPVPAVVVNVLTPQLFLLHFLQHGSLRLKCLNVRHAPFREKSASTFSFCFQVAD